MKRVYSIGYQGLSVQEFIRKLEGAGIGLVADVRAVPLSRKPGFSKNVLAAHLKKAGIDYVHVASAGNPTHSLKAYATHLRKDRTGVDDLQKVIAGRRRVAVLCFEADPAECHRSLLLAGLPVAVIHL